MTDKKMDFRERATATAIMSHIDRHGTGLPLPENYMSTHRKDFVEYVAQAILESRNEALEEAGNLVEHFPCYPVTSLHAACCAAWMNKRIMKLARVATAIRQLKGR